MPTKIIDSDTIEARNVAAFRKVLPANISTLDPDTCLNDVVIDAYTQLLASSLPDVVCFPVDKLGKGATQAYIYSLAWHFAGLLTESAVLLFPVHLEHHWIAAAAYSKQKVLVLYDSLPGLDGWIPTAQFLMLYLAHQSYHEVGSPELAQGWSCYAVDGPKQTNGTDCGAYALRALKSLAQREEPPAKDEKLEWETDDGEQIRDIIRQELLDWKLT